MPKKKGSYRGPELDDQMTWKYLKESAFKRCPYCKAPSMYQVIQNYMELWKDGHIYCNNCWSYLGTWESEPERLIA